MKWLADENFRSAIVRGLLRRSPELDVVRAQDIAEISGEADTALLAWATANDRVVLTHDSSTMVSARNEQLARESVCAPIVLVRDSVAISLAVEDILLLDDCATEADWGFGIVYLPLR